MIKILIVDDEKPICDLIDLNLSSTGYHCTAVQDGLKAIDLIEKEPFDLVLLDIMLPGADGYDVMEYIRPLGIPVIFITAKYEVKNRVKGLKLGADDYIVKPFDLDELDARVAAHLRREQRRQNISAVKFFGELAIDYTARTVTVNGEPVTFSRREFDILELLSLHTGQVFDRERIYESIWGIDGEGSSDVVMEHVRKIRAKLAARTFTAYIETVWGCGYRWKG